MGVFANLFGVLRRRGGSAVHPQADSDSGSASSTSAPVSSRYRSTSAPVSSRQQWVKLNVGGKIYATTLQTLTGVQPDSVLALMFTENPHGSFYRNHTDQDGAVLIDRNPELFSHIIHWLRTGEIAHMDHSQYVELLRETDFFQLNAMTDGIMQRISEMEDLKESERIKELEALRKLEALKQVDCTRKDLLFLISLGRKTFNGLTLTSQNLSYLEFNHCEFFDTYLEKAILHCTQLDNAHLLSVKASEAEFYRSSLRNVKIQGSVLTSTDFARANIQGGILIDCNFVNSDFMESTLAGATIAHCRFTGSTFDGSDFRGCKLYHTFFDNCSLIGVNLSGSIIQDCIFSSSDLRHSDLNGVDLDNDNNFNNAQMADIVLNDINFMIALAQGAVLV